MKFGCILLLVLSLWGKECAATEPLANWIPGLQMPPQLSLAVPDQFVLVSFSAQTRQTKEFDLFDGVIWAPERTARRFEFRAETKMVNLEDPLFVVRLTGGLGQEPGTKNFRGEDTLAQKLKAGGIQEVRVGKRAWGSYPLLTVSGLRPDGAPMRAAYLGINAPTACSIAIDFRVPSGSEVTGENRRHWQSLWDRFLTESKPVE